MRIIDADELVKKALTESCFDSRTEDVFLDLVDSMPTVDAKTTFEAEPVRHGRWEKRDGKTWCSLCGASNKAYEPPYCPHCGVKMDGGVSNEGCAL